METKKTEITYRKETDSENAPWQQLSNIDELIWDGIYLLNVVNDDGSHNMPLRITDTDTVTLVVKDHALGEARTVVQTITRVERSSGKEFIYTRTRCNTCGEYIWSEWTETHKNIELGKVTSFDIYTESGNYSGVYTNGNVCENFSMVVIDNKAVASAKGEVRSVNQFKYSLNLDGTFSFKTRIGHGNESVTWNSWVDIGAADTTDIQDNSITAQKLSIDVRKKLENTEVSGNSSNDLDFVDVNKNCIARFAEGHIMTKNFDSRKNTVTEEEKAKLQSTGIDSIDNYDFAVTDEQNNAILVIADGHIKTKQFDSRTGVKETKYIDRDIYALGDSTTQGAGSGETSVQGSRSWFDRLVTKIQFRSYRKLAANGATTMKQEGLSNLYSQVTKLPVVGNPIILVMIGTNDINRAHAKGDINAVLAMQYEELGETASFAEAYRYNLETIKRRLPNAELIAMMPLTPQPNDESGAESYRDIERGICKALSIPIFEVRNECGINKYCNYGFALVAEEDIENATVFMADALHPNNAGYERIANYIASKLNKYIQ